MESRIICPKCGSDQVTANQQGYSAGKGLAGAVLTGGVGLLAGFHGSKKVEITCLSCGKSFMAGEGKKEGESNKNAINSDKVLIDRNNSVLFDFVSNFDNFGKLMPEQVADWQSTADTCSFTISGMAALSMRMALKQPNDKIVMASEGEKPFPFELICHLVAVSENSTEVQLIFDAKMSPMIAMMATRPLNNFINILVNKLKTFAEENL